MRRRGPPRPGRSHPSAREDLAPEIAVAVFQAVDEPVGGTPALLDERGDAREVDALVLPVAEHGAPFEPARRDRDQPLGEGRERRAAEARREPGARDGRADGLELLEPEARGELV